MTEYEELLDEYTEGGFIPIRITEGLFKGVKFHYTKVSVEEKDEDAYLSFEYTIIENYSKINYKKFETCIGDILVELLKKQITESSVVYSGGT